MDSLLVMLVDDDHLTNQFNSIVIKKQIPDVEVMTFTMASSALDYLRFSENRMPAIIFLDLNMPGMNGWDFMQEFETLNLDIEVVVLTSSQDSEDRDRSKAYGHISGFESKPLSQDRFKSIMNDKPKSA